MTLKGCEETSSRMAASSSPIARPPHVLAFPFMGQGHVIPMLHLCQKLLHHGCLITFVNTLHNHQRFLSTLHISKHPSLRLHAIADCLPPEFDRVAGGREQFESMPKMGKALEELIEKAMIDDGSWGPFTCILSDVAVAFTQDVANKFGLPRAAFWTQSGAAYASHLAATSDGSFIRFSELTDFLHSLKAHDQFLFNFFIDPFYRVDEAAWMVINTFQGLEADEIEAIEKHQQKKVYNVGPLLPGHAFTATQHDDEQQQRDHPCLVWLEGHAPSSVLYICLQSIPFLSKSSVEEIALGVEASQCDFLWVVRSEWLSDEADMLPQGFKNRTSERGMLVSWAPQLQVLCHNSVGAYLTHCGWNSTLESISRGVPMLGFPGFGDQPMNCRFIVEAWNVGMHLGDKDGVISRKEVEMKIHSLMIGEEGKQYRQRASHLRAIAKQAVEDGGSSNKDLLAFVNGLKDASTLFRGSTLT